MKDATLLELAEKWESIDKEPKDQPIARGEADKILLELAEKWESAALDLRQLIKLLGDKE